MIFMFNKKYKEITFADYGYNFQRIEIKNPLKNSHV